MWHRFMLYSWLNVYSFMSLLDIPRSRNNTKMLCSSGHNLNLAYSALKRLLSVLLLCKRNTFLGSKHRVWWHELIGMTFQAAQSGAVYSSASVFYGMLYLSMCMQDANWCSEIHEVAVFMGKGCTGLPEKIQCDFMLSLLSQYQLA